MDLGAIFGKIRDFFVGVVDYFKNFKSSVPYKFGDMIYAFVLLVISIVKAFT